MKGRVLFLLLVVMIIVSGCLEKDTSREQLHNSIENQANEDDMNETSELIVDLAGAYFIFINGKRYDAYSGVLSDETSLGEEIGITSAEVSDKLIQGPKYELKNGDAAFVAKGTKVFEITGAPEFIAIKDDERVKGYSLFQDSSINKGELEPRQIVKKDVKSIEIYKRSHKKLNTISDQQQINNFKTLLMNADYQAKPYLPKVSGPAIYEVILYSESPIADVITLLHDGSTWYHGHYIFPEFGNVIPKKEDR